jgi:putative two-component system response regulator
MQAENISSKILCIDDDPSTRALTVRALGMAGYRVEAAGSARAGMELAARARDTALIIIDVHMPEVNGFEMAQMLKDDPVLRTIPVMMITSTADPAYTRQRAQEIGAVGLVSYPFTNEELVAAVRAAIDSSTGRAARP